MPQFREAIPCEHDYRFVIVDRDTKFPEDLRKSVRAMGVRVLRTPPFAPQANSYCERLIGSTHREYLDFLIPLSENYLRRVLADWRDYYNQARTHSAFRIPHSAFIIHHSSLITGTQCPCAGERSSRRSCFAEALYSNWIPHRFLADSRGAPSRLSVGTRCLTERRPQTQGLSPSLEASALALAFHGLNAVQASRTRHVRADGFRRSGPISELRCRFDRPTLFFADHTPIGCVNCAASRSATTSRH